MISSVFLMAAALVSGESSLSGRAVSPQVLLASADKKEKDPNERICKREKVVGSLTGGKKTCHTRAEWEEMDMNARKGVREFQQDRRGNGTLGG